MLRVVLGLTTVLLSGVVSVGGAVAGDAKTIRIEPRAFYGATISLESGVRVFRPLPRTTHVIINPNRTPMNISIKEVTKRIYNRTHVEHSGTGASGGGGAYVGGYIQNRSTKSRRGGRQGRRGRPDRL